MPLETLTRNALRMALDKELAQHDLAAYQLALLTSAPILIVEEPEVLDDDAPNWHIHQNAQWPVGLAQAIKEVETVLRALHRLSANGGTFV